MSVMNWLLVLLNRLFCAASVWLYFDIWTVCTITLQGRYVQLCIRLSPHSSLC